MKEILVHGCMKFFCMNCNKSWIMQLEIGVEDEGKNGRLQQPSPMFILCECGEFAQDISGYMPFPTIRPLLPRARYFKYDDSRRTDACGIPSIFITGQEHQQKIGRNEPCPCNSGRKYKKCCIDKEALL
jgi:hypothetical protein